MKLRSAYWAGAILVSLTAGVLEHHRLFFGTGVDGDLPVPPRVVVLEPARCQFDLDGVAPHHPDGALDGEDVVAPVGLGVEGTGR